MLIFKNSINYANFKERISLILINYHILFSLLRSLEALMRKDSTNSRSTLESSMLELIYASFKRLCQMSNESSEWCVRYVAGDETKHTKIIRVEQSSLVSTLALRERGGVSSCVCMRLVGIYFQWCAPRVFEPMNVYEKCKVFMCSMRCSDSPLELECMIKSLNEIILNAETARELRVILLKEHLSYLLKLASTAAAVHDVPEFHSDASPSVECTSLLSLSTEHGLRLVSALIDLFESMVFLVYDPNAPKASLNSNDNESKLSNGNLIFCINYVNLI